MSSIKKKSGAKKTPAKKSSNKKAVVWTRSSSGGRWVNAVDRVIDESAVAKLLLQRDSSKTAKDYAAADHFASQLQAMGVCYVDESNEWYTRPLQLGGSIEFAKKIHRPEQKKRPPGHVRAKKRKAKLREELESKGTSKGRKMAGGSAKKSSQGSAKKAKKSN